MRARAVYTEEVVEGFDGDWRELPPVRQADVSRIEDFNKGSVLLDPSKLGVEEGGVGVSGRNDAAARKAGLLINNGYSLTETIEELLEWNKFNRPPLEREEVIRTARSITQRMSAMRVREKEKEKQLVEIKEGKPLAPTRTETLCNKRFRSHSKEVGVWSALH